MKHLFASLATAAVIAAGATTANAGDATGPSAQAPATLVIYRAGEELRTRQLAFNVHLDGESQGRLRNSNVLVVQHPAGEYTLDTTLPGDTPITVNLQPGSVHYIHTRVTLENNGVSLVLDEVGEQVAVAQRSELQQLPI